MSPLINQILERFAFPPGSILLLMILAWLAAPRAARWTRRILGLAIVLLYLFSIPITSDWLVSALERIPPLTPAQAQASGAQAIVVLGHGRYPASPEYAGDTVSTGGLARLRYAAFLHRHTGLPLLAAGGHPYGELLSESLLMKRALENEFQVPVRWVEEQSRDTWENALFSQQILAAEGIGHVLLVTHGLHMPRSVWAFQQVGLQVTPAPTLFRTKRVNIGPLEWLPAAMDSLRTALHEHLGLLWYRLRRGDAATPLP